MCGECIYNGTIYVPNEVRRADIAVVGECPGEEELKAGKPFVGKSGKLLWDIFKSFGISRDDVAILNSCRCPLTKNKAKALKACKNILLHDLSIVAPKVVITLGDVALKQLTGNTKISEMRGRVIQQNGFVVVPTYHPSYLLRSGKPQHLIVQVMSDIDLAVKCLRGEEQSIIDTSGYVEGTYEDAVRLAESKIVAMDVEFTQDEDLLCVGFSNQEGKAYVFFPDKRDAIQLVLNSNNIKVVVYRPVDEHILRKHGFTMNGRFMDVLTMAHIYDENIKQYSLENLADIFCGMKHIKDFAEGMRENLSMLSKDKLIKYNGVDCDATYRLFMTLNKLMEPDLKRYFSRFMTIVQDAFAEITFHGIPIDHAELNVIEQELLEEKIKCETEALSMIPSEIIDEHNGTKSLSSNRLVSMFLFTHEAGLRLKYFETTEKNNEPSTSEKHLKRVLSTTNKKKAIEFIEYYLKWKKLTKIISTYISNLREYDPKRTGFIYPTVNFTNTVTGRTSMSRPSMQNFPKRGDMAKKLRRIIKAREGYSLVECDLSQSELRIMGWLAGDDAILSALREGIDLHTLTASKITNKSIEEVTKDERHKAKCVNFGFIYGMSAASFVEYARDLYGISLTLDEANEIRSKFFRIYRKVPLFHAETIAHARRYGYVRQPLGRRRRLLHINSDNTYEQGEAERQAINFPIQSFSSDLALLGLTLFHNKIINRDEARVLLFIHDAVIVEVKDDKIDYYVNLLVDCMTKDSVEYIRNYFNVVVSYPVEVEVKVGKNLAEMEDYNVRPRKI